VQRVSIQIDIGGLSQSLDSALGYGLGDINAWVHVLLVLSGWVGRSARPDAAGILLKRLRGYTDCAVLPAVVVLGFEVGADTLDPLAHNSSHTMIRDL
jgi:hypothetical protein